MFVERLGRDVRAVGPGRAVAWLNHPNILTVYDVGTDGGTPYVVTELLEGDTWRDVLARRTPTPRQVITMALQAAQGLAAAHVTGIVHRDLKPENLFLTTDGRAKILDFGLVLYEMLTGRHPFRRDTVTATLAAILQDELPPIEGSEHSIPAALEIVVRRCTAKRRGDRYADGHALALALEEARQAPAGATLQEMEERSPYPALRSLTERDAAVFFGREHDVAALWARIRTRRLTDEHGSRPTADGLRATAA